MRKAIFEVQFQAKLCLIRLELSSAAPKNDTCDRIGPDA